MLVFLANSIPFPFILSKCLPFWCVQSVEVVLRNCCWHNMAAHQLWPFVTQSQRPAAKFLSYQLINTQPCSLHVVDFRPRLNHPRWLSVFTNTALPTLCWKLTTDICHIVTVLKTSQIWPVYADYRGTLLKPRFWSLKMQNLSFTFMNIGYTLILSHFIDESHQIYVADHEPQSQALSINKV